MTATTPKRSRGAGQAHTRRDGRASKAQVFTAVPLLCVSRRSPAAALQARDKGQIHAQGTNSPRRSRRWPSLGRWTSFWGAPRTSWLLTICDCFFAVLSRVEWISVELIGCKTRSRLQKRRFFCNFSRNFNVVCNPDTVSEGLGTTRKTSGIFDVLVFLRGLYVGISIATWVAKVAQLLGIFAHFAQAVIVFIAFTIDDRRPDNNNGSGIRAGGGTERPISRSFSTKHNDWVRRPKTS